MGGENTTESKVEVNQSTTNKGNNNTVRKNSATGVNKFLVLIIVLLVGVVGFMAYQFLQEDEDDKVSYDDGRATFVSPENVEDVKEEIKQEIEDAFYTTSMTVDWRFHNGKAVSTTAFVENATDNKRTVYFDVNLKSTGELVYSSPYLPVGSKLEGFALDKELPKGDYPAVVTYYLVDDDHKVLTSVAVSITIHVLN